MYIWNHLYKQKWTRQGTKLDIKNKFINWYYVVSSNGTLLLLLLFFIIIINFIVQNITFDDLWGFLNI